MAANALLLARGQIERERGLRRSRIYSAARFVLLLFFAELFLARLFFAPEDAALAFFADASRSVFLRRAARFLTLSLPLLFPIRGTLPFLPVLPKLFRRA